MRDTDLAITFFTFLTLLANAATLSIIGAAAASRSGHDRAWTWLRGEVRASGLGLAWVVAAVATSGSLYFSEVAGFVPCRLCWAQRAVMYPLVVVLALAGISRNPRRWRTLALAMAGVGAAVATYHVLLERFPSLETGTCDPRVPCSLVWFERLGFVTLPYMALSAFVLVGTLLVTAAPRSSAADPGTAAGQPAVARPAASTGPTLSADGSPDAVPASDPRHLSASVATRPVASAALADVPALQENRR